MAERLKKRGQEYHSGQPLGSMWSNTNIHHSLHVCQALVFLCDETVLTQQLRKRSLACWHGWVSDTSCRVEGQVRQPAYYVMPSV